MVRRIASLSTLSLITLGCVESVAAPGSCPEFCPEANFSVVDSVIPGSVVRDSSFRGYVASHNAAEVQIVGPDAEIESRVLITFVRFPGRIRPIATDTTTVPITAVDSFAVKLEVDRARVPSGGVDLALHRLPVTIDSTATFSSLVPNFEDSSLVGTISITGDLTSDNVSLVLPTSAFPTFDADDRQAAIGVRISRGDSSFVSLSTQLVGAGPELTRFFKIDSSGVTIERSDARRAGFTSSIQSSVLPPTSGTLEVGGLPSARAIIRADQIEDLLTSNEIIRATLELIPSEPVRGAPGDTLTVRVAPVAADFGSKSPLVDTVVDSLSRGGGVAAIGSMDTIHVDMTALVRAWTLNSELPRTIMLVAIPEGTSLAELRFFSSGSATGKPAIRLTYVPPVGLSGP